MKTETINSLYKALLNHNLTKYQKPISSRWMYQLATAKQYLERRFVHQQFTQWFLCQLEAANKVPDGYLKKWRVFNEFLHNEKLNIEIEVMVRFGEWFYEKVMFFLIGRDTYLSIQGDDGVYSLPNGYRAAEMPDKVEEWINILERASEQPDEIFIEELLMANEVLSETEFVDLAQIIQNGLEKSLDVFKKWMDQWKCLPFSICRLGGKCGPDFALAVANVVLDYPFPNEPTERVKKYMDELAFDLRNQKNESFGLFEALDENEFRVQFLAFSQSTILEINKFPLVFDFRGYV